MRLGIPSKNSDPKDVMILGFRKDSLNTLYRGKRLDEVAQLHGKDADETLIDLLLVDKSPAAGVYFLISEANMNYILDFFFLTSIPSFSFISLLSHPQSQTVSSNSIFFTNNLPNYLTVSAPKSHFVRSLNSQNFCSYFPLRHIILKNIRQLF